MEKVLSFQQALHHFYDVIVVGSGPAGTAAAAELASQGVSVLLTDRAATFPRDKACGDALPPSALRELQALGVLEQVQNLAQPVSRVSVQIADSSARSASPPVREVQTHLIIPRRDFDAVLWKHALSFSACSWLPAVTVQSFTYDGEDILLRARSSTGEQGELRARAVIAADGSRSRLARQLRKWHFEQSQLDAQAVTPPWNWTTKLDGSTHFTAMRGYCRSPRAIEYFDFEFPLSSDVYYYWIFPVSEMLWNVGLVAKLQYSRANRLDFSSTLATWLTSRLQDGGQGIKLESLLAAPIDGGMRDAALYGRQIVCAGDAAALADTILAGGIADALWSGRAAARSVKAWLDQTSELSAYGKLVWERYLVPYYLSPPSKDPRDSSFWLSSSLIGGYVNGTA